jgi:hypothetical protein
VEGICLTSTESGASKEGLVQWFKW